MIWQEMLNHKSTFNTTLHDGIIEEALPQMLLQFVCMIEHGVDIKSQIQNGASKSDVALAQPFQYSCYARTKQRQRLTGTPRIVKHHLLYTWVCLCLPKPGKENSLKCFKNMGSGFHMTGKSQPSWVRHLSLSMWKMV